MLDTLPSPYTQGSRMSDPSVTIAARARLYRFHGNRDRLLAEAHARPFTPLAWPTLGTRISASAEGTKEGSRNTSSSKVNACVRLSVLALTPRRSGGRNRPPASYLVICWLVVGVPNKPNLRTSG